MRRQKALMLTLKKARTRSGLSQKRVSKLLGYRSGQFISNWERGVATPPVETIRKLSKAYKISANSLFNAFLADSLKRTEMGLRKRFSIQRTK